MKVLLLDPNIAGRAVQPPHNLPQLKAYLRERTKHRAALLDFTFRKTAWRAELARAMDREKPDLIGISCQSLNYAQAVEVAAFVRSRSGLPILFGGVHAILAPEEVIATEGACWSPVVSDRPDNSPAFTRNSSPAGIPFGAYQRP